jgi:hypothetical protein
MLRIDGQGEEMEANATKRVAVRQLNRRLARGAGPSGLRYLILVYPVAHATGIEYVGPPDLKRNLKKRQQGCCDSTLARVLIYS